MGVTMSQCHKVTKSQSHKFTKSQSHKATKSQSHKVTMSQCHKVTKSQSHKVTKSQSHNVTMSQCHKVTRSQCTCSCYSLPLWNTHAFLLITASQQCFPRISLVKSSLLLCVCPPCEINFNSKIVMHNLKN